MIRLIRSFVPVFILVATFATAADEPKDGKKIEMPKLPKKYDPKWDLDSLKEKFTVIKRDLDKDGAVFFLVELKEDMAFLPTCKVTFHDKEGVRLEAGTASFNPGRDVKKGDRVRLTISGYIPANDTFTWPKTAMVKFSIQ